MKSSGYFLVVASLGATATWPFLLLLACPKRLAETSCQKGADLLRRVVISLDMSDFSAFACRFQSNLFQFHLRLDFVVAYDLNVFQTILFRPHALTRID